MSLNSRLQPTKIIGQRKTFYRQRIAESSCTSKETVAIDVLVPSRNVDRKIIQSIRIISRPTSRKGKWSQLSQLWRISTKVMPNIARTPSEKKKKNYLNVRGFSVPSIKNFCKKNGLSSRISQNDVNEMIRVAVEEVKYIVIIIIIVIIIVIITIILVG